MDLDYLGAQDLIFITPSKNKCDMYKSCQLALHSLLKSFISASFKDFSPGSLLHVIPLI